MTRKMGIKWHLRQVMATRDMFSTSDLVPLLADRGVRLSREQVYRLVTQPPQRLNMEALAALCDILDCQIQDLIEVVKVQEQVPKSAASGEGSTGSVRDIRPVRAKVRRPNSK